MSPTNQVTRPTKEELLALVDYAETEVADAGESGDDGGGAADWKAIAYALRLAANLPGAAECAGELSKRLPNSTSHIVIMDSARAILDLIHKGGEK